MSKFVDRICCLKRYQTKVSDLIGRHGYSGVANNGEKFRGVGGLYKFSM